MEAHREAERLEHALSASVEQALWEHLGRPLTCPHGNPISGLTGQPMRVPAAIPLERALPGQSIVDRIYEQMEGLEERLIWVEAAGLLPGAIVELIEGRLIIIYGQTLAVPEAIAAQLLVRGTYARPLDWSESRLRVIPIPEDKAQAFREGSGWIGRSFFRHLR